ncbi:DNA polymerase Y family protein [Pseudoxanthomonas sp. X-1]|uniref:Y-family DNA polymerase n=1 Tax=Pseudoxanthomonas sp. X-1 TaxID=2571115 RepID=UPI00110B3A3A|nr:DNA polymerase Y family protein [Pseudoxanthomonas sp. X-1]TMN25475.1 DNA polymerase Y family protein [Pseudoxanthomonas sp. X-1]UAY76320.1 DNA polymerase Y family protein [Pseudoxanthomonas sp. X-1]
MLWACILLPHLAMDTVLRRLPEDERAAPLALVEGPAQLRRLHSVNAAAAQAGLTPGMRLSAAHALLAQVRTVDFDAQDQARSQRFLASWAYRHSSLVSQQWPHAIVLEARASFRLFGPWPRFARRLRQELETLGFRHRLALAPTPRAAQVLAGREDGLAIARPERLQQVLDAVPVRAAHLPDDSGERLHRMGLHTLAALRALPRDGLRRRFGLALLEHLDRLYGQADDPLDWYTPPDHFDARVEMGYEVENHMALLFPLRRLVGDLCTYLSIRDGGVQRFVLRLEHEQGHSDVEVGLLAPERNQALLFELARNRLERVAIDRPVVGLRLLARQLPPFVPAVRDLFDTRPQQALDWPQLRERLRARLGDAAVYRVEPAGDPRPEKAWRRALGDAPARGVETAPARPPRPAWLLPQPVALHGPARIISGPERLESGWWDQGDARRDYYVVETARGQRAWAFQPAGVRDAPWMLHGWFG